jgi:putative copper export protein
MQTWTVVRFLHLVGIAFFVGGQLMLAAAVAPAVRKRGDDDTMRLVARRFGIGSVVALALAVATGVAMASHFSLWDDQILQAKLMVLVFVGVLTALHVVSPKSRALSYGVVASSLLVLWLGVKLTYG